MANRTNASVEYDKLTKILQYEIQRGCYNKAVITGLEPFVAHWQEESLARGASEQDRLRILGIVDALKGYAELDPADRLHLLTKLLDRIDKATSAALPPAASPALFPETTAAPSAAPAVHDPPSSTVLAGAVRPPRPPVRERRSPPAAPAPDITRPITAVSGISTITAGKFNRLGVETVEDLLNFFPRRYVD